MGKSRKTYLTLPVSMYSFLMTGNTVEKWPLLKDEGIFDQGMKVEVEVEGETGFWPGDRRRQILIIGLAVLIFLLVSALWFKKSWFGRK